ncbi:MAG: SBBP repeat-containing protein [Acidobacteriia bacterium]|nr:SBBP repeat-containing protein [Terriglobia bacterium]
MSVIRLSLLRFSLFVLMCAATGFAAPGPDAAAARAKAVFAAIPLHFEENRGQWNSETRFAARSGGKTLLLTNRGAVLASPSRRVDVTLVGGNTNAPIEPLDRLPARTDYFRGRRSYTGISQFARVAYRSVYPGIDLVYYGSQEELEYDFVVQPAADPRKIRLHFRGADHLSLNAGGDLVVAAGDGQFIQKRPILYQQDARTGARRPIEGHYRLLGGQTAGLAISQYDSAQPLVVDPVLLYATFLGGSATDSINAVATDSSGFIYIAGNTTGGDLPATPTGIQGNNAGGNDVFVAIINPNLPTVQSLRYLTFLGGGRDDIASAIAVDSKGLIYVTGTTSSSDFPLAGNSLQTTLSLSSSATVFNTDAFVSVIDRSFGLQYSTYFGGTGDETPHGIGVDARGFIYIGGTTTSPDMPTTTTAYQAVSWGSSDTFVLKIDTSTTTPAYASYLGGEDEDDGRGFAVAPNGLVYFAASTLSTEFPTAGPAYQQGPTGTENLIIGVMDLTQSGNASLPYCTYFGGSNIEEVRQLFLTADNRLLLTGWTLSPDFPISTNAFQSKFNVNGNAFVTRVNPQAPPAKFVEYSTFLGGSGGEVGYAIAGDTSGAIYVAGYTLSADFPVSSDAALGQFGSGIEAFLVKLNPSVTGAGALAYGSYFGGEGFHVATGLAVAADGSIFVGGYTTDALRGTFSVLGNGFQSGFAGGYSDGFVLALK